MAKITTITNPLTGQPVQVDQLEHTAQQIDDGIDAAGIESIDYPGCYYRMVSGVVEWFNPPMLIGKEYRTTERYQGKPVYAQCVKYPGVTPSGYGEYAHGIANISNVIRASGELRTAGDTRGSYMPVIQSGGGFSTSSHTAYFTEVSRTYIAIYTGGNHVGKDLYVTMYYTKTTD